MIFYQLVQHYSKAYNKDQSLPLLTSKAIECFKKSIHGQVMFVNWKMFFKEQWLFAMKIQ